MAEQNYINQLQSVVERSTPVLLGLSEADSARHPAPGKWSPREVLGHLIDSASHNHQRFVRARFQDDLVFQGYEQDGWVSAQAYQESPWAELVALWRTYNLHVARVMALVPEPVRTRVHHRHNLDDIAWHTVAPGEPTTLDYLMGDYVDHLTHHLRQILRSGWERPAAPGVRMRFLLWILLFAPLAASCASGSITPAANALTPRVVTEPTTYDTDDPAIWINSADKSRSLIVGTDKDSDGALYVYDLGGRIVNRVGDLKRPNNVDIAYGLPLGGTPTDIAVTTEREKQRLRVFSLPDMKPVDNGDLVVFEGDTNRAPMGIALYRRPRDGAIFAFVGGKSGPRTGYIGQYRLADDGTGHVKMALVRQFGAYSGTKEIEAIAVDAELGYVYYSDETVGVRKYAADPDAPRANTELALFATSGFAGDHEGISIYKINDGTGYILVSDQQANQFRIYPREGAPGRPHEHTLVKTVPVSAIESDGSEVTSLALGPKFPRGLFVAMSNGGVFHYYAWEDVAGPDLKIAPNGVPPGK